MILNNIVDYIKLWNEETPDKIAMTFLCYKDDGCYEDNITFNEFYNKVRFYAGYLIKAGVKKGDRVTIIAKQCPETIYCIYSVLLAGGIFVLVPPIENEEKKKRFIFTVKSSESEYVLGDTKYRESLKNGYIQYIDTEYIEREMKNTVEKYKNENNVLENRAVEDIVNEVVQAADFSSICLSDIACLQYTSGSISDPKGVMISHNNIMEAMKLQQKEYFTGAEDINVTWLPYFHTMELICDIFLSVYTNRRNVLIKTADFMEKPCRWFEAITKYKATITKAPISGYIAAVKDIDDNALIDLSSLKYMISASEPVHERDCEYIYDSLSKYGLKNGVFYTGLGMTEATTTITIERGRISSLLVDLKELENGKIKVYNAKDEGTRVLSCAGEISEYITMKVVNPDTLKECLQDEVGEIWIQGGCKACGYWKLEEKTKEIFMAELPPYKGTFLRSGDLGYVLNNKVYITGRLKDVIIINGHNIYTKDIEYIIKERIEELKENIIQVFSISKDNEEQLIIVVENEDGKENYSKLAKDINTNMLRYFNIEAYDILFVNVNILPRTDNGKFSVKNTKQMYERQDLESLYSLRNSSKDGMEFSTETSLKIKEIFEKILGVECKNINDNFFQLGGSSLKIIKLIKEIKISLGITMKTTDILKAGTIKEIEDYINQHN